MSKKIYSCEEHIDRALDDAVDDGEGLPPEMSKIEEDPLSTTCEYCQNDATYVVAN